LPIATVSAITQSLLRLSVREVGCAEFSKPIGCGLRVQWILYAIATNSALVVSISFWSFVIIFVNNGKLILFRIFYVIAIVS